MFQEFAVTLAVESYIAHPYWEETERVVNIQKKSGMNKGNTGEEQRAKKLRAYLASIAMPVADYEALVAKAAEEWHRDAAGNIIIPRHQLAGALVNTLVMMPSSGRPFRDGGVLRSMCQISDFTTDRQKADGTWIRFVRPTKDGRPLSNQRSERRNQVLKAFTASGILAFDPDEIDTNPDTALAKMRQMLDFGGKYVGLGASRKMGHGRYTVKTFQAAELAAAAVA